ncbi:MAG: hypothetical protein ABID09_07720 [Candidatus Omnitrophota bacterium]
MKKLFIIMVALIISAGLSILTRASGDEKKRVENQEPLKVVTGGGQTAEILQRKVVQDELYMMFTGELMMDIEREGEGRDLPKRK